MSNPLSPKKAAELVLTLKERFRFRIEEMVDPDKQHSFTVTVIVGGEGMIVVKGYLYFKDVSDIPKFAAELQSLIEEASSDYYQLCLLHHGCLSLEDELKEELRLQCGQNGVQLRSHGCAGEDVFSVFVDMAPGTFVLGAVCLTGKNLSVFQGTLKKRLDDVLAVWGIKGAKLTLRSASEQSPD